MADFDDGKTSTFGRELMSYISAKLPYSGYNTASLTDQLNPKYKYFEVTGERRAEALSKNSISQNFDFNNHTTGQIASDKAYSQIMYANIQKDKAARVRDYRVMAANAEVANALDEICDESINKDAHSNSCLKLQIRQKKLSDYEQETLDKEFIRYTSYFDFEHKGWEYFRQLLVEGEIYWEHIVHEDYREEGILGVVQMPTELIDPVFSNVQNVLVKGFLLRKPKFDPNNPLKQIGTEFIPMDKNQVTYVNSNVWNESKTMRVPFLENCRRAYRQLLMVEDAIIIYRLARAPERLVFNVDVGNMPGPKAEGYLKKLMTQYWSSKSFDPSQGGIINKFNPQSILDNFWFAKRTGSEGTTVQNLAGGCFAMDTKIVLIDGRILTIAEIENEMKAGNVLWTKSVDYNTGDIKDGIISWAGVTQKRATVIKLTFSNGNNVICTPEHKYPIHNIGYVEAKDLKIGQELMSITSDVVKLVSVVEMEDPIEVGTLTIDNQEKYHNYHTFALDAGIFTKNSNLGQLEDLMYFVKKLYQALKVPTTRLDPQDAFRDGADMLREELKFAKFIIRIQQTFAGGLKNGFMTHLQLRGIWNKFDLKEHNVQIEFNVPTNFYELRESQKMELKTSVFSNLASNEALSPTYLMKKYLGFTDIEIKANREYKRIDEQFKWELAKIGELGPDWKTIMAQSADQLGAGAEGVAPESGGGGGMPSGGGIGGDIPPSFGGAATPEAGATPEPTGGATAPEPNTPPATNTPAQ